MKKLTKQEAFDIFWQTFVVEKAGRSVVVREVELPYILQSQIVCVYSHPDHPGCGIGCLLSPEIKADIVAMKLNSCSVPLVIKRLDMAMIEHPLDINDVDFYASLQQCHDNDGNWDAGIFASVVALTLARTYNLTTPTQQGEPCNTSK